MTHLNVNEMFTTVQGEGRAAGQLATFLRLSGCNLSCAWCDTPYTWDWSEFSHDAETHKTDIGALADILTARPGRIVVTGGEPLLQSTGLAQLHRATPGKRWDLETNGTRSLGPTAGMWDVITCSPKVGPSAGQDPRTARAVHESIVDAGADFKFVIADQDDLAAATRWIGERGIEPARVWLMPEGTNPDTITARTGWVADSAIAHGYNFTSRLHVLAWGDTRGT